MRSRVNSILERKGIEANIVETIVGSAEEAETFRFPGSPTARVNGRDVEPQAELQQNYGLG